MNELILIDCMKFMKTLPDEYFDLAIVDPPYGIGVGSVGKMTSISKKEYVKKDWDKAIPTKEYFSELRRISVNQIIWGANFFDGFGLVGGGIVWNKLGKNIGRRNPMPDLSDCEYAYCSFRTNIKMFSYTYIGNVVGNNYQIDWNQDRIHPTQKPTELYSWLLKNYAKPNDKLFDSHSGSGSFRIAAHDMGFDLTSCEIDEDYYRDNEKRFQNHIKQNDLFAPEELQKEMLQGFL